MGNTLIILGSARHDSDTKRFVDMLTEGIPHERIDLLEHPVAPYNYDEKYPANDAFLKITEKMLEHDTIVFATPVYWYAMSALMKNFFDRINDLVSSHKHLGRKLKGKNVILVAVGWESKLPHGFASPFRLTARYLEMNFKGSVYRSNDQRVKVNERALSLKFSRMTHW